VPCSPTCACRPRGLQKQGAACHFPESRPIFSSEGSERSGLRSEEIPGGRPLQQEIVAPVTAHRLPKRALHSE
jgi:hypothetical protein